MGTFAGTANNYRLSFADQGKQTSLFHLQKGTDVCRFCFPFAANTEVAIFH
jgi:hypothetical protein